MRSDKAIAAAGDELAAALAYSARGWHVFPVTPGKTPRTANGFKDATTDPARIAAWWQRWPDAAVGIATGAVSGIVVIDVDPRHGGVKGRSGLGRLPHTYQVLTGGGGEHLYFLHPGGEVPCSTGKLGAGVDVKGDGGYVIAPPSLHASGHRYKVLRDRELAPWPVGLLNGASPNRQPASKAAAVIPEGSRNAELASLAGTMRHSGLDASEILAALREVNANRCKPPLLVGELEQIALSVGRYKPAQELGAAAEEPFTLEALTARALCALPDPPASDQLLGPLVVRGQRLIIGAHTGEGKTTLSLRLVRALVLGEEFLEWSAGGGQQVLVIDAEQGLKTVKRRLAEAGLAESELVDYVRVPDGLALESDERHAVAVEELFERGEYGAVVADPLYKLHTGDSNAEREAVDLMRRFDAWRERYRFALVLPVHCRKPVPGLKFSIHDLFGSSAYTRGAEVVLGLQRLSDGRARLHFLKDRDGDLPTGARWGLLFDQEQGFRRDPKDGEPPTRERVAELRASDPGITQAQVAAALGVTERTVRKYWHDDDGQKSLLDE